LGFPLFLLGNDNYLSHVGVVAHT